MKVSMFDRKIISAILLIILCVMLSNPQMLVYLTKTYIGRSVMLLIIIMLSSVHVFLGLVAVLFVIISASNIYNHLDGSTLSNITVFSNFGATPYFENFETKTGANVSKHSKREKPASNPVKADLEEKEASVTEGFNLIERESNILKGKRSSEIPVKKPTQQPDLNIVPHSGDNPQYSAFE
jgi:hypothetical protein